MATSVYLRAEYDLTDRPESRISTLARLRAGTLLFLLSLSMAGWRPLIVETSNFTENTISITNGLPSSTESLSSNALSSPPTANSCSTASS